MWRIVCGVVVDETVKSEVVKSVHVLLSVLGAVRCVAWLGVGACTCCVVRRAFALLVMRACTWRARHGIQRRSCLCVAVLRACLRGAVVAWPVHANAQCSRAHGGAAENKVRMMADGVLALIMGALKMHAGVPGAVEAGLATLHNLARNGTQAFVW